MTAADTLTCPVCGNDMPPLNSYGKPRKVCSGRCGGHLNQHRGGRPKTRDYYAEEVEHLASCGVSTAEIVARIGIKAGSLARAMDRAERPDLARLFYPLRREERRHRCTECGAPGVDHKADRCVQCGIVASQSARRAS